MKSLLWLLQLPPIIATPWINLQSRQSGTFAITGIQNAAASDGSVPFRLELQQLKSNADQWNMYLLALDRLQTVPDQSDLLSFYSIAAIHGEPYVPWDGVQGISGGKGYCTHASELFATWHRPYLALYEQVLYGTMQQVVNDFPPGPDHDRYASAASSFRIPYWDWAAPPPEGQSAFPDALSAPTVVVNTPNGTATIGNPLYAYKFHPNSNLDLDGTDFSSWQTTLRYPTPDDSSAVSQDDQIAENLGGVALKDRLYTLFTGYSNFTIFSNKRFSSSNGPGGSDSLESLHDSIHGNVGGGGHMSYIDTSAFDPVFWLHHTMVDRAFAIWQALYPDSYVEPEPSSGTFTTSSGTIQDVNSGLTPFHTDTTGDFWTSAGARLTGTFGYSYPELPFWTEASDPAAYQASLRSKINNIYGPSTTTTKRGLKSARNVLYGPQSATPGAGTHREWIANTRAQKSAMSASFFLYIFLGDPNPDPKQWGTDPNLAGSTFFFGGSCTNCQDTDPVLVSGAVPLTTPLLNSIHSGHLKSLEPQDVEPYLKTNMHWRVSVVDGTTLPADQVPGLTVSVASSIFTQRTSNSEFPKWGPFSVHTSITDSRPGGLRKDS